MAYVAVTLAECHRRSAYYYRWWEMYPTNSIQVVGSALRPGDAITASVVRSNTTYTLAVSDSSNPANSFTETGATVNTTSASGVISNFTDDEITMIDSSGAIKAQPGDLNASGNEFSAAWKRSS